MIPMQEKVGKSSRHSCIHRLGDDRCRLIEKGAPILYTMVVVILILGLLGWLAFPVGGLLIHLLLVLAVVALLAEALSGRRSV